MTSAQAGLVGCWNSGVSILSESSGYRPAGNKKARSPVDQTCPRAKRGFALVVTLSLMILLTVIAVGLLTLSSISLRSSNQSRAMETAKANARMAMMLALGELQKQAGPDTRVTARADVLAEENPPVLGVWKSWEGTDHRTTGTLAGRPVSPGDYAAKKKDRFLAWLVSGSTTSTVPDTAASSDKVTLVGTGSVGDGVDRTKLQIHLAPSLITANGQKGAYAWWVGGENQKARLPQPYKPPSDSAARWAVQAKSHSVADTAPFRMDALLVDPAPAAKAVTLRQSDLIATKASLSASSEFFHDLSAVSVGLLTNSATGGWRKDLSLLTEKWDDQPTSNLPFFRVTPTQEIYFTKPSNTNPVPGRSMLYPWAAYRGDASHPPMYRHGAVTSWENLKDYATAYKRITASSSGRASIATQFSGITDGANLYQYLHKVRVLPLTARIQCLFSHSAGNPPPPAAGQPAHPAGSLEPRLLMTPIITLWNPYNVEIIIPTLSFVVLYTPEAFRYTINGTANNKYNSLRGGNLLLSNQPSLSTSPLSHYGIAAGGTLKPGETRVFSPTSATPVREGQGSITKIDLTPGYRSGGGEYFPVLGDDGKPLVLAGSTVIKADAKFDTLFNNPDNGVIFYIDMYANNTWALALRYSYTTAVANTMYKPLTQLAEGTLSQVLSNPIPFLSTMLGARMASNTHLPAKGFVQSSPLVNYTAMGGDFTETTIARRYGGTRHPVNSPFDYSFIKHAAGGDAFLPNADPSNHGYIVTGFQSSNGLSSCVINELPTRPLQSLGELQNWDLRYENPIPPYALNLIGNSDATPLLPADSVVNAADSSLPVNLQHDDSYCANHLLFDDWFFSSIAPNPDTYGAAGKSLQETFKEFVSGATPLGNRAYRALAQDVAFASAAPSNATQLYTQHINPADSWKSIASRLEVDGMFNVNSTSVTAWRALLGHARNQKVPFIKDSGASWGVDASQESDYAVSRFSIAGDTAAGSTGRSGLFSDATQFAGYRVLNGTILDAFAVEIVKQIRTRGPFLSLSEFVNRQLSSGNLALAGTIQAALNELAKNTATNPTAAIDSYLSANNVPDAVAAPEMADLADYKFPDAAAGKSVYGLPGWTRQADVLRPLAPILSARDDTFKIRSYGDARDASGRIVARAVVEATVRRTRDYVDPGDLPEISTPPANTLNKTFGRRFQIISFQWLTPGEV